VNVKMGHLARAVVFFSSLLAIADAACVNKVAHKPWDMLTSAEQTAYINAELCLMAAPSKLNAHGAETRWDDLQLNHVVQTNVMHDVGHFLPWHRYFVALHGNILRDECDYTGPLPYWDETADSSLSKMEDASVFQEDAFGGGGSGSNSYISNGPFANTTLRVQRPNQTPTTYRISRRLNSFFLSGASLSSLNTCFQMTTYTAVWECLGGSPHSAGHGAAGGLMLDVFLSPGDPMFFLHHGWLDVMWWKWQTLDLPGRLTDMGGRNVPRKTYVQMMGMDLPGPEWTNYQGETGNTTTLNHVIYNAEIAPNVTVSDVMDVGGDAICAEYFFSDALKVTTNTIVDGFLTAITE
jgi:tyrosinase